MFLFFTFYDFAIFCFVIFCFIFSAFQTGIFLLLLHWCSYCCTCTLEQRRIAARQSQAIAMRSSFTHTHTLVAFQRHGLNRAHNTCDAAFNLCELFDKERLFISCFQTKQFSTHLWLCFHHSAVINGLFYFKQIV